jgi:replicative DNA helicase
MASRTRTPTDADEIRSGNIPPHSTDAEVAVLGAMLIDKDAVSKVVEVVDAECFYHEKHVLIFKAMMAMFERGVTIDLVSLSDQLQRDGTLERVGGMFALTEISVRTVSSANVEYHARIVLERFLKRQLIKVAGEIAQQCYDETTDALDEVDRVDAASGDAAARIAAARHPLGRTRRAGVVADGGQEHRSLELGRQLAKVIAAEHHVVVRVPEPVG